MPAAYSLQLFIGGSVKASSYLFGQYDSLFILKLFGVKYTSR